jgi:hypothetical protein
MRYGYSSLIGTELTAITEQVHPPVLQLDNREIGEKDTDFLVATVPRYGI